MRPGEYRGLTRYFAEEKLQTSIVGAWAIWMLPTIIKATLFSKFSITPEQWCRIQLTSYQNSFSKRLAAKFCLWLNAETVVDFHVLRKLPDQAHYEVLKSEWETLCPFIQCHCMGRVISAFHSYDTVSTQSYYKKEEKKNKTSTEPIQHQANKEDEKEDPHESFHRHPNQKCCHMSCWAAPPGIAWPSLQEYSPML